MFFAQKSKGVVHKANEKWASKCNQFGNKFTCSTMTVGRWQHGLLKMRYLNLDYFKQHNQANVKPKNKKSESSKSVLSNDGQTSKSKISIKLHISQTLWSFIINTCVCVHKTISGFAQIFTLKVRTRWLNWKTASRSSWMLTWWTPADDKETVFFLRNIRNNVWPPSLSGGQLSPSPSFKLTVLRLPPLYFPFRVKSCDDILNAVAVRVAMAIIWLSRVTYETFLLLLIDKNKAWSMIIISTSS